MKAKVTKRVTKSKKSGSKTLPKAKRLRVSKPLGRSKAVSLEDTRHEVHNLVDKLPGERLQEIKTQLEKALKRSREIKQRENKGLKGIWAGKGFETIDIEKEIRDARDAMQKQILDRHLRNELHS